MVERSGGTCCSLAAPNSLQADGSASSNRGLSLWSRSKHWKPAGEIQWRSINLAQAHDSIFITVKGEERCRASLDRAGEGTCPYMGIFDYLL